MWKLRGMSHVRKHKRIRNLFSRELNNERFFLPNNFFHPFFPFPNFSYPLLPLEFNNTTVLNFSDVSVSLYRKNKMKNAVRRGKVEKYWENGKLQTLNINSMLFTTIFGEFSFFVGFSRPSRYRCHLWLSNIDYEWMFSYMRWEVSLEAFDRFHLIIFFGEVFSTFFLLLLSFSVGEHWNWNICEKLLFLQFVLNT